MIGRYICLNPNDRMEARGGRPRKGANQPEWVAWRLASFTSACSGRIARSGRIEGGKHRRKAARCGARATASVGDSERFANWDEAFRWLKGSVLKGVMFVVFDEHGGLTQAIAQHFQGPHGNAARVL